MKTVRRPPYPKWNPGYFPCSSLTPPFRFPHAVHRCPSVDSGLLILDPHDLLNGIWTKDASSNITRWSHPRIEEIAELQARELDQVKRKALIDEAAKILMEEDNWHAPLYWTMRGHFSAIQIQNHHPVAALTDALKVEHYWCDPAC